MIVEYIQYRLTADEMESFHIAYEKAGRFLSASDHCVEWEMAQGVEEPTRHTVRIVWDDQHGHEVGFRGSAEFGEFLALLSPFGERREEMLHFAVRCDGRGGLR